MTFILSLIWAITTLTSLKNTKWLLAMTLLSLPAYQLRFAIAGIPVTILELSILILFTQWLFTQEKTRIKSLIDEYKQLARIIVIFIIAATISVFIASDLHAAAGIWKAYFIEPILFFIVFIDTVRTKADIRFIIKNLALVATAIGLTTIAQSINLIPTPELWKSQGRFTGLFAYPNAVGLFLAPLIPLFVAASSCLCKKWDSVFLMFAGFVSVIAIFLASTEGAIVALIGSFIIWGLFRSRRWRAGSVLAIILGIFILYSQPAILDKVLLKDWSGTVRRLMWQDTITMIEHHPIAGAGLSGYPETFAKYHKHTAIEIFQYPHNIVLNQWSETGLLGLVAFFGIIMYFGFILFKHHRHKDDFFFHAVGVSMLVLLIHGLVDVPYFKNDLAILFWIIVGILIANPHIDSVAKQK